MARSRNLKVAMKLGTVIILLLGALIICAQTAWLVERVQAMLTGGGS